MQTWLGENDKSTQTESKKNGLGKWFCPYFFLYHHYVMTMVWQAAHIKTIEIVLTAFDISCCLLRWKQKQIWITKCVIHLKVGPLSGELRRLRCWRAWKQNHLHAESSHRMCTAVLWSRVVANLDLLGLSEFARAKDKALMRNLSSLHLRFSEGKKVHFLGGHLSLSLYKVGDISKVEMFDEGCILIKRSKLIWSWTGVIWFFFLKNVCMLLRWGHSLGTKNKKILGSVQKGHLAKIFSNLLVFFA